MRFLLLGVLARLAAVKAGGPTLTGVARGSDSVMHTSIDGHKTCSAFDGCRGGDCAIKMVSGELASAGAGGTGRTPPCRSATTRARRRPTRRSAS